MSTILTPQSLLLLPSPSTNNKTHFSFSSIKPKNNWILNKKKSKERKWIWYKKTWDLITESERKKKSSTGGEKAEKSSGIGDVAASVDVVGMLKDPVEEWRRSCASSAP